jgi:transcriptional regulator with XRE-family HTH domain
MDDIKNIHKNRLRELRKARKWSYRDLSEKTNIFYTNISKIENGQRDMTLDQAILIADLFKVPLDYLFYRGEKEQAKTVEVIVHKPVYKNEIQETIYNLTNLLNDDDMKIVADLVVSICKRNNIPIKNGLIKY